jgi:hypothetical protein
MTVITRLYLVIIWQFSWCSASYFFFVHSDVHARYNQSCLPPTTFISSLASTNTSLRPGHSSVVVWPPLPESNHLLSLQLQLAPPQSRDCDRTSFMDICTTPRELRGPSGRFDVSNHTSHSAVTVGCSNPTPHAFLRPCEILVYRPCFLGVIFLGATWVDKRLSGDGEGIMDRVM